MKANRVYSLAELIRLQLPLSLNQLGSIRREQFSSGGDYAVVGNIANLTLAMRAHGLTVHCLSPEALSLCKETEVYYEPLQCPELLKKPGIIQVADIKTQVLFHRCMNIGWYWYRDDHKRGEFLRLMVGMNTLNGESDMQITEWKPEWKGGELAAGSYFAKEYTQNFPQADIDLVAARANDARRLLLTVALMLEAERTPIYEKYSREGDPCLVASDTPGKPASQRHWRIKYFYATQHPIRKVYEEGHGEKPLREGLSLEERRVKAHIRLNQPYGPRNSLRKTVYIAAYDSCRWVSADKPTKVLVK